MFYELKISKNGLRDFTICKLPLRFKSNKRLKSFKIYNDKLDNSISRAKNKIFDYAINNDFYYFVTLTINEKNDRFNLDANRRKINELVINLRKKGIEDLFYILIPEYHKNGAIHFHGLFSKNFNQDFYINDNGFLSWSSYDKIGFSSISKIKNFKSCCKYITKYITKDLCKIQKGKYLYFNSKGLKTSIKVGSIITSGLLPLNFDFSNKYCDKVTLDYYNFITFIDFLESNNKIILSECNIESM